MKKPFLLFSLLVNLLVSGMTIAGEQLLALTDEQSTHLGVRITVPQRVDVLPLGRAPARVVLPPENEFMVSALQSGIIENVSVALGANVSQGQVMARIQSPALLEMQRTVLDAATEYNVATARLERDQTLLKEGIIARLRWLETQSQFDRAEAALRTAEQALTVSGFGIKDIRNLESGRKLNSLIEIRSPVSGTVLERIAVVGQRVELLAPLFRVGRLNTLWLEVAMPQERLNEIATGDRIHLETPEAEAKIIQVSRNVDAGSQTALVRAVVERGNDKLHPGMNVNVQLLHNSHDQILRLPLAAVFVHEAKHYVFVKTAGGYEARKVGVAGEDSHSVVVHEGLDAGDKVVVEGVAGLKAAWVGVGEGE